MMPFWVGLGTAEQQDVGPHYTDVESGLAPLFFYQTQIPPEPLPIRVIFLETCPRSKPVTWVNSCEQNEVGSTNTLFLTIKTIALHPIFALF
jgi:hypothetical protein